MSNTIKGTLKAKFEAQQVSDKFKKRDFVITDNSTQYPQHVQVQLTQDKCSLIDNVQVGQEITVHINLRGREWISPQGETKYFNTIEGWKIEAQSVPTHSVSNPPTTPVGYNVPADNDLPF